MSRQQEVCMAGVVVPVYTKHPLLGHQTFDISFCAVNPVLYPVCRPSHSTGSTIKYS